MKIKDLCSVLPEYQTLAVDDITAQLEVSEIVVDSRHTRSRCVFVALRGTALDSHQFLEQVCAQNPAVLVVEDTKGIPASFQGLSIRVADTRKALDLLASRFYGDPSRRLLMFGVTGTNGKTSSTYLLAHILNSLQLTTGVIGTINHHLLDQVWETQSTTPGPLEVQQRLSQMLALGAKAAAIEVTSHALAQRRCDSVQFNTVLFTNLTRDHLDYHKDMQDYFATKQKLFTDLLWQTKKLPAFAVINIDDPYGRKLRVAGSAAIWTYGQSREADFRFKIKDADFAQTQFQLTTPFGEFRGLLPFCGEHNVYNAVGVIASAATFGIPVETSIKALRSFTGVPGRLQSVPNKKNLNLLIDYAHTPDALDNVLRSLSEIRTQYKLQNQIICIFGCGGDRDKGKRPQMAAIAEKWADKIIVTSDNPRTEDPGVIIHDILEGFTTTKPYTEVDRRKAIQLGISLAQSGDVVLIAGKGHETYQQIGVDRISFSDYKVASEASQ